MANYILNTFWDWDPVCTVDMLREHKAAAYKNKEVIDEFKKDDVVFLYQNGVGIIAMGMVNSERKEKDYTYNGEFRPKEWMDCPRNGETRKNEEFYVELSNFTTFDKPIRHDNDIYKSEIKKELPIKKALYELSDEKATVLLQILWRIKR